MCKCYDSNCEYIWYTLETGYVCVCEIQREINPEYSLERLMLELKFQYFGHLMRRPDSLEKTLMLRKIEGRWRRGWQRMRWLASPTQWTWVWANSRRQWRTGKPGLLQSMGSQRVRHDSVTDCNNMCVCGCGGICAPATLDTVLSKQTIRQVVNVCELHLGCLFTTNSWTPSQEF